MQCINTTFIDSLNLTVLPCNDYCSIRGKYALLFLVIYFSIISDLIDTSLHKKQHMLWQDRETSTKAVPRKLWKHLNRIESTKNSPLFSHLLHCGFSLLSLSLSLSLSPSASLDLNAAKSGWLAADGRGRRSRWLQGLIVNFIWIVSCLFFTLSDIFILKYLIIHTHVQNAI